MAKQITDWQEFPDTTNIYKLENDEMIINRPTFELLVATNNYYIDRVKYFNETLNAENFLETNYNLLKRITDISTDG